MPQLLAVQVFFMQTPQTLVVPLPPQVSPAVMQLPQSSMPPQPSLIFPQLFAPQVFFMQTPQTLVVPPPPQVSPAVMQLPQSSMPPQPSPILPQFLPWAAHVVGVQHLLL